MFFPGIVGLNSFRVLTNIGERRYASIGFAVSGRGDSSPRGRPSAGHAQRAVLAVGQHDRQGGRRVGRRDAGRHGDAQESAAAGSTADHGDRHRWRLPVSRSAAGHLFGAVRASRLSDCRLYRRSSDRRSHRPRRRCDEDRRPQRDDSGHRLEPGRGHREHHRQHDAGAGPAALDPDGRHDAGDAAARRRRDDAGQAGCRRQQPGQPLGDRHLRRRPADNARRRRHQHGDRPRREHRGVFQLLLARGSAVQDQRQQRRHRLSWRGAGRDAQVGQQRVPRHLPRRLREPEVAEQQRHSRARGAGHSHDQPRLPIQASTNTSSTSAAGS